MRRATAAESAVPEIRFRPAPEVYAKVAQIANSLGLTVTDVARMGLAQLANAREIRLVDADPQGPLGLRDLPVHGTSVGRVADIAAAAARVADQVHAQAGRLAPNNQAER